MPQPNRVFAKQIRKGGKVATSPAEGTGGVNILRYGVMVALQILALSVRVRVLLSQLHMAG